MTDLIPIGELCNRDLLDRQRLSTVTATLIDGMLDNRAR